MTIELATQWLRVDLRVDSGWLQRELGEAFESMSATSDGPADRVVTCTGGSGDQLLRVDSGDRVVECPGDVSAASCVAAEVNRIFLDECPHLAVHAAVLAAGDTVLAIPGVSAAGKSTLAAACTRVGFDYVSDEALVLTDELEVIPYPRPLGLSKWSRCAVGLDPGHSQEALVSPFSLGGAVRRTTSDGLSAVVVMKRSPGAPALSVLSRARGAALILENSFNHYADPVRRVDLVHRLLTKADVWELRVGEPNATARLLADRFC